MRTSRYQRSLFQEWLVLAITVGLSLILLFFSKSTGVAEVRGDMADAVSIAVKPLSGLAAIVNIWHDYDEMRARAMELSIENETLRDAILENERLRAMLDFKGRSQLDLIPASVIARVGSAVSGRIRINAGFIEGVRTNSAVMTPHGLVGKVIETADHSALVQTLVGNNYGVSVIIERTRLTGILRWIAPGDWIILGLPSGADIKRGDVIVTSGAGSVFPKSIRTGIVTSPAPRQTRAGQAWSITPLAHFGTLEEVFVVAQYDPFSNDDGSTEAETP
jgi:rod shape-determining protein MreC